jgi:diguanylate cyclase (GGDEF)-like protein/putative nucleotidyltransferase with HDIG domain
VDPRPTRRRPTWRGCLLGLTVVLFVLQAVQLETGWGGPRVDTLFQVVVYDGILILAGVCCAVRRCGSRLERRAWLLLGAGVFAWALGDVYYELAFADTPDDAIPFPSLADAGYLAFYPPVFVGLGLLVRSQLVRFTRAFWIDGLIAALTVGAVAAAVVFDQLLEWSAGDAAAIAVNLAYPVGDLILLALTVGFLALGGRRLSLSWGLIAASLGLFAVSDSIYLVQVANGTYVYGSHVDLGWPAALVLLAIASATQPVRTAASEDMRALPLVPAGFALVCIGLVVYDHFTRISLPSLFLAAAALLAVVVRLCLTLVENGAMLRASQRDAVTDPLTGLRNRRRLQAYLEELCARDAVDRHVLMLFDLDGFKGYNDSYGHPAGDALLARLAARLTAAVGDDGDAYRLGGDEFCVVATATAEETARLRDRAVAALAEAGEGFSISSSCGVVEIPAEAPSPADALRIADVRMYEEKNTRPSAGKQTMRVLLSALQERDPELAHHTGHVTRLAAAVAEELGLDAATTETVRLAAQLHDIGKIAIPDSILTKPEPLSESEWSFMKRHTIIGERIVSAAPALGAAARLIRSSHERWDGTGYPDRKRRDEIPVGSRIVFVCDAYEAMISGRPYQPPFTPEAAQRELQANAGTQFDPDVVDAALRVLAGRSGVSAAA